MPPAVAVAAAWVGVAAAWVGLELGAAAGPPQAATTSASPASRLNEARYLVCIRQILPLGRRLIGERRRPILYRSEIGTYSESVGFGTTAASAEGPRFC